MGFYAKFSRKYEKFFGNFKISWNLKKSGPNGGFTRNFRVNFRVFLRKNFLY